MITKYSTKFDINTSIYFTNAAKQTENEDGSIRLESNFMFSGATLMMFSNEENTVSTGHSGSIPMMFEGDIAKVEVDAEFSDNWEPMMVVEAFDKDNKRIFEYTKDGQMVEFQTAQNNFRYKVYLNIKTTGGPAEAEGSTGWVILRGVTTTIYPEGEYIEE